MSFTRVTFESARAAIVKIRTAGDECQQASSASRRNAATVSEAANAIISTRGDVDRLVNELDVAVSDAKATLQSSDWESVSKTNLDGNIAELEQAVATARANYTDAYAAAIDAIVKLDASITEITDVFARTCDANGPAFLEAATVADRHIERVETESNDGIRL